MRNFFAKIKDKLIRLFQVSYGMDELNKVLVIIGFVFYLLGSIFKRYVFNLLSLVFFTFFMIRFFSRNRVKRLEENRAVRKLIKEYKMKWQYRNTHKIFRCKTCGQLIRVPLNQGKIETTCPNCGTKESHRT